MRSYRFINSLLYLVIQLVAKESKAKENNARITLFLAQFIDKLYIPRVIQFKRPPPKSIAFKNITGK